MPVFFPFVMRRYRKDITQYPIPDGIFQGDMQILRINRTAFQVKGKLIGLPLLDSQTVITFSHDAAPTILSRSGNRDNQRALVLLIQQFFGIRINPCIGG